MKIEELLSAAFDGEVSVEEHAQAEKALNSPEWASHAAFLSILKDSARFEDSIEMPASLSERIAQATYARPTLWSRISAALRPAPMRYAAGGLALSGLAAIGLVMLRPPAVKNLPTGPVVASPAPSQLAKGEVTPTPEPEVRPITPRATPKPVPHAVLPTPEPERPSTPAISNRKNVTAAPVVTPHQVADAGHNQSNQSKVKIDPPVNPKTTGAKVAIAPIKKSPPLAPPRIADSNSEGVPVAQETPRPTVIDPGDSRGQNEGTSVVAVPPPVTIASSSTNAAALRDPEEANPQPVKHNPDAVVKIPLNLARGKLSGLSAQPGVASASGNRMSLVNDNEKR